MAKPKMNHKITKQVFASLFKENVLFTGLGVRLTDAMINMHYREKTTPLDPQLLATPTYEFIDEVLSQYDAFWKRGSGDDWVHLTPLTYLTQKSEYTYDEPDTYPDTNSPTHNMLASMEQYLSGRPMIKYTEREGLFYPDDTSTDPFWALSEEQANKRLRLWVHCFGLPSGARAYFKARRDLAVKLSLWKESNVPIETRLAEELGVNLTAGIGKGGGGNERDQDPAYAPDVTSDTMKKLSQVLTSDYYFWIAKAVQMALARKGSAVDYAIVSNDILMRYANQISTLDNSFTIAINAAVKALYDAVSGVMNTSGGTAKFVQAFADEKSDDAHAEQSDTYTAQSGFDSAKSLLSQGSALFKYLEHKGTFKEFAKLVAIGVLGGYAFVCQNPDEFNLANLESLWLHSISGITSPSLTAVSKVMSTMYDTLRGYQDAPPGTTFSTFIRDCVDFDSQITFANKLLVQYGSWGVLDIEAQCLWKEQTVQFMHYAESTLGAKKGWISGKGLFKGARRPILTVFQTLYEKLSIGFTALSNGGPRKAPFAFVMLSGSSVGKTYILQLMQEMLLTRHMGVPKAKHTEAIYVWNGQTEHMDGFTNGKLIIVLDDVAALLPKLYEPNGGDPQLAGGIQMINNVACIAKMADLPDKGKVFVAPNVVMATSNVQTLGLANTFVFPAVMQRRFKLFITVSLRKEFATGGNTLDEAKVIKWNKENPGVAPNAWDFKVEVVKIRNSDDNGKFKIATDSEILDTMDTRAFMKWLSKSYVEHMVGQTAFMAAANTTHDWSFIDDDDESVYTDAASQAGSLPDGGSDAGSANDFAAGDADAYSAQAPIDEVEVGKRPSNTILGIIVAFWTCLSFLACMWEADDFGMRTRCTSLYSFLYSAYEVTPVAMGLVRTYTGFINIRDKVGIWLTTARLIMGEVAYFLCLFGLGYGAVRLIGYGLSKPAPVIVTQAQDAKRPKVSPIEIPEHAADLRPRYVPPFSGSGTALTLSKASKSVHGSRLSEIVAENHFDFTFRSSEFHKFTLTGALTGVTTPTRASLSGHGLFLKGKWAIINAHFLPQYCRRGSDGWREDWAITMRGIGPAGVDVTLSRVEFMRTVKFIDGRDVFVVRIDGAALKRDITGWMVPEPTILDKCSFGTAPMSMMAFKDGAWVATRGVAISTFVGNDPKGELHDEGNDHMNSLFVRATYVKVNIPAETVGGDCGFPYIGMDGDTCRYVAGLHTGACDNNNNIKIMTPIFLGDALRCVDAAPMRVASVMYDSSDPEDELHFHPSHQSQEPYISFDRGYEGMTKPDGEWVRIHNQMETAPGQWGQRNEAYILSQTGLVVNPNMFVELGCYKPATGGNLTSGYYDSPCADAYRKRAWEGLPGPLNTNKVVANLNRTQRNLAAATATGALFAQKDDNLEDAELLMHAAAAVLREFSANGEISNHIRPYDEDVAINGRRASADSLKEVPCEELFLRGCEPINKTTSAGWPWVQAGFGSGKLPWLNREEDGTYSMGKALSEQYHELEQKLSETEYDTKFIFKMCPKDEPVSEEKYDICKIRMILVGPLEANILMRKYLMCFCRVMAIFPFTFSSMVGVDATSVQWAQIHNFIVGNGAHAWDGDYKDFDKNMINMVILAVLWVFAGLMVASGNYDARALTIAKGLLRALSSPVIDVFGVLYWVSAMNTSGNTITTQFGCVANNVYITYSFFKHLKAVLGAEFDFVFAERLMRAIIRKAMYGDDNLVSCLYDDVFDCVAMQSCLAGLIVYTDAKKSSVVKSFTPTNELQFLGRTFVKRSDNRITPPLEWARITKMIMFYRKLPGLDFANVIKPVYRAALMESYFHGREVYDIFFSHLACVLATHFEITDESTVIQMFLSHSDGPLTWDFFDDWYEARADSGWIHDPRYVEAMEAEDAAAAYAEFCRRRTAAQNK